MNKIEQTAAYFAEQAEVCNQRVRALEADHRADEAVFEKIRMNVFDIFASVFSAAVKTCGGDNQKIAEFFLNRMESIPGSWLTALDTALQHGDSEKAHIERIKLDAADQIKSEFLNIWEAEK